MDIGKQQPVRIVTPIENPVPQREERPARRTVPPRRAPERTPEKAPVKSPEKV